MSISDPDNPYRYLELRGWVGRIDPDPTATFFRKIANATAGDTPPPDAPRAGEAPHDRPRLGSHRGAPPQGLASTSRTSLGYLKHGKRTA